MDRIIQIIYRLGLIVIWGCAGLWLAFCVLSIFGTWGFYSYDLLGITIFIVAPIVVAVLLHMIWRWLLLSRSHSKEEVLISKPEPLGEMTDYSTIDINKARDDVAKTELLAPEAKARAKVAEFLSEKDLSGALARLMGNDSRNLKRIEERVDRFKVDDSKTCSDFPDCTNVLRFTYKEKFYELFCENEKEPWLRDGDLLGYKVWVSDGDFRIMIDGELSLKSDYQDKMYIGEHSNFGLTIILSGDSLKTVKGGQWIDDLPELAELCRKAEDEAYFELSRKIREENSPKKTKFDESGDSE